MFVALTAISFAALTATLNEDGLLTVEGTDDVTTSLFESAVNTIPEFETNKPNVKELLIKGPISKIESLPEFNDYPNLITITLENVREIGSDVFYRGYNNAITTFNLGEAMETVRGNFQYYFEKLLNLSLGPNVKSIHYDTVSFLGSITVDSKNKVYYHSDDKRTLILRNSSVIVGITHSNDIFKSNGWTIDYKAPNGIKEIGINDYTRITAKSIDLNEIEIIGQNVKFDVEEIASLGKISEVKSNQFSVQKATSLVLPNTVKKLEPLPFGRHTVIEIGENINFKITETVPFLVQVSNNMIIQYNSFENAGDYVLDGNLYNISEYSFSNFNGSTLTIKNLKTIPSHAFSQVGVKKIILDGVEEISRYAFNEIGNDGNYIDIEYKTDLKYIRYYAFDHAYLTGLPPSVEYIESYAYSYAKFMIKGEVLKVPKKMKVLNSDALGYITITSVDKPDAIPILSFEESDVEEIQDNFENNVEFRIIVNDNVQSIDKENPFDKFENLVVDGDCTYNKNKNALLRYKPAVEPEKLIKFTGIASIGSGCFLSLEFPKTSLEFPDIQTIFSDAFYHSEFYNVSFQNVKDLRIDAIAYAEFTYFSIKIEKLEEKGYLVISNIEVGFPDIQLPDDNIYTSVSNIKVMGIDGYFEKPLKLKDFFHNISISSTKSDGGFTTTCVISGNPNFRCRYLLQCNEIIFDESVKKASGWTPNIWSASTDLNTVTFKAVEQISDSLGYYDVLPKKFVFPSTLKKFPGGWITAKFVEKGGKIEIANDSPYKVDGNMVISKDGKTIYRFLFKSNELPTIPSSVETLEEGSLFGITCETFTVPGTVRSIINAFSYEGKFDLILSEGVKSIKQDNHRFTSVTFPKSIEDVDMDFKNYDNDLLYFENKLTIPEGCKGFKTVGNLYITSNHKHLVAITEENPETLEFDCENVIIYQSIDWSKLKKVTFTDRVKMIEGEFQKAPCTMKIPQLNYYPSWMQYCTNMIGNVTVSIEQDPLTYLIDGLPKGFGVILNVYEEPLWAKGGTIYGEDIKVYAPKDYKGDTFMGIPVIREDREVVIPPDPDNPSSSNTGSLTGGQIAGIVIGVIVAVAVIGALLFFFVFRKKKTDKESSSSDSNDKNEV